MTFTVAGKLLDACVLGIIADKDTYGYDLTQKVSFSFEVSESALYPVLRRLSKEGLLCSYDKSFDGRIRKYYHITDLGQEKLEFYQEEWEIHEKTIKSLLTGGVQYDKKQIFKTAE